MPFPNSFHHVIHLADQAAAEIARTPDEFEDDIIGGLFQPDGPEVTRLQNYVKSLPRGEIRMLTVLMCCGRARSRNTKVASNIIDDPTHILVDQMLSKSPSRLRDYLAMGMSLVRLEDLRRFDDAA